MCGIPATCECTEVAPLSGRLYDGPACECDVDNCFNEIWNNDNTKVSAYGRDNIQRLEQDEAYEQRIMA